MKLAAVLALALLAGRAEALSCVAPDPLASFERAATDSAPWMVLVGELAFDASALPQGVQNAPRDPAPVPARLVGRSLSADGFATPFAGDVTLVPTCAGPWCGGLEPGGEMLIFARIVGGALDIDLPACGGTVFDAPDAALQEALRSCLINGGCG